MTRAHDAFLEPAAAVGDRLVGEREPVAHRTARGARQQPQRTVVEGHAFGAEHLPQVLAHGGRCHRPQVELQAAAQHRRQHLLRVGGREHEFQIVRRLLERLQQRIEGVLGELVRLVDHEDLVAADAGLVGGALDEVADLVDAAVAGGVELDVVEVAVGVDLGAGLAHAAGLGGDAAAAVGAGAVQALGQDARDRRLADAARAGEQVGVVQPPLLQRIRQRLHHVFLPHHLREAARTVFAGQDDVRHALHSTGGRDNDRP